MPLLIGALEFWIKRNMMAMNNKKHEELMFEITQELAESIYDSMSSFHEKYGCKVVLEALCASIEMYSGNMSENNREKFLSVILTFVKSLVEEEKNEKDIK